jgi:hypothetical protein
MISDEELNQIVDNLVLNGYIELEGIDPDSGEFLYRISDKLNELIPNLREKMADIFLEEVYSLWTKGFVSMDFASENPLVRLTENAFDQEKVDGLSLEEKATLSTIMDAMKKE